MVLNVIIAIILALLIAALEMANSSLETISEIEVEEDIDNGNKRALRVLPYIKKPNIYRQTIFIVNFILYAVIAVLMDTAFYPWLFNVFNTDIWIITFVTHVLILMIWLTFVLVFSTMIARRIGYKYKASIAYSLMPIVSLVKTLSLPINLLYDMLSKFFGHAFGLKNNEGEREVTEEQIRRIVETSSKHGNIEASESEMIQNIFDFTDTTVDEIMTHRIEIEAINSDASKEDVLSFIVNGQYTRFPVYEKDIDHIIGTFHVKDLLKVLQDEDFSLKSLLRKPYFIPDSKRTAELFAEMQKEKNHFAVILDEYGGTAGIVTMEDLIEEIVGNIFDEYDIVEEEIKTIDEHTYVINGLMPIDDVDDVIDADLPIDDYDTLSGFILGQLGRFPKPDEDVEIVYESFKYTVLSVDDNVITKVKVEKIEQEIEKDDD